MLALVSRSVPCPEFPCQHVQIDEYTSTMVVKPTGGSTPLDVSLSRCHTLLSHSRCHTPTVTPQLPHPRCYTPTVAPPVISHLSYPSCHPRYRTPAVTPQVSHTPAVTPIAVTTPLSHPRCPTPAVQPQLSRPRCHTPTLIPRLSHHRCHFSSSEAIFYPFTLRGVMSS